MVKRANSSRPRFRPHRVFPSTPAPPRHRSCQRRLSRPERERPSGAVSALGESTVSFFSRRLKLLLFCLLSPGGERKSKATTPNSPVSCSLSEAGRGTITAPGLFRAFPLCPREKETDILQVDKGQREGAKCHLAFSPQTSSSLFLSLSRILFARSLSLSLWAFASLARVGHAQSQLTKGHDGARVDRPHGGGSSARSRRDGRRRRRAGGPCDGRDDCRRARGDASSARHTEGRHCGVQSQWGRGEGRTLLGTRRCGGNSLSLGPDREREESER